MVSVGFVEGWEAVVEPVEEGPLEQALAQEVDDDAHDVDCHAGSDSVQPQPVASEVALDVEHVAPKPGGKVAVGVDEQHAEGGRSGDVDETVVAHGQVLEEQKEGHGGDDGHETVGVGQEIVDVHAAGKLGAEGDGQYRRHRQGDCQGGTRGGAADASEGGHGITADVSADEVDGDEPADVAAEVPVEEGADNGVDEQQGHHEPSVCPLVEGCDEFVDKRHEQEQGDERGGEGGAHEHGNVKDRVEAVLCRERLTSHQNEDQRDGEFVKLDLEVEFEEFAPSEMPVAHEKARDQQETVDADLATPSPKLEKDLVAADAAEVVKPLDSAGHDIVVGNDHEHQDNPEQLDVAVALLGGSGHRWAGRELAVDDDVEDAVEVSVGEFVMDGYADDGLGHACCVGQVLAGGAGQAAIGGEGADERIEVAAGKDVLFAQLGIQLIAGAAITLGIDKDGEVAVVVAHAGHVVPETDALDGAQRLAVADSDLAALGDGGIDLTQVEQAIGRTHLVHLAVDTGSDNLGFALEAEVLEVVDAFLHLGVTHDERPTLDGVIDLSGMETQRGHVALVEDALAIDLDAKGMGAIVDDAQAVLVGNLLNLTGAARLAIDMHGHDGRGARRDGSLDSVRVDASRCRVDVHKHGLDAVPPQRVGRRHKAVGRSDDLTGDIHSLQSRDEGDGAVSKDADVGDLQVVTQSGLESLMKLAIVSDPLVVPDLFQHLVELSKVGEQGRRDCNHIFFHNRCQFLGFQTGEIIKNCRLKHRHKTGGHRAL